MTEFGNEFVVYSEQLFTKTSFTYLFIHPQHTWRVVSLFLSAYHAATNSNHAMLKDCV